jgi:threonine dehydratase
MMELSKSFEIPQLKDIQMAFRRVSPHIQRTPLLFSPALSRRTGAEIFLKMECWQLCGCFKVRGAINMISALHPEERRRGLITCSSGNHGAALAYAASLFGHPHTKIFVPEGAESAKLRKIEMYGGEIIPFGSDYLETLERALAYAEECEGIFIHSHDHPLIVAGQGTIGLEIFEDLPDVECIIVPVGGGGLISGISLVAKSANPKVRLIGVEPAAAPGAFLSFRDGFCHERVEIKPSVADGLLGTLTPLTFAITHPLVEQVAIVEEEEIFQAIRVFEDEEQVIVEGAAAVTLAAILSRKIDVCGQKVTLVVTGRNISAARYNEITRSRQNP